MKRFGLTKEQTDFAAWLALRLPTLLVHLNLTSSKYVPGGIDRRCCGVEEVLASYKWVSEWKDGAGAVHGSCDWPTTKQSLRRLGNWLKETTLSDRGGECETLRACQAVISWGGGNRSKGVGADRFTKNLAKQRRLRKYLVDCRSALRLASARRLDLSCVEEMNAMMSKVHALLASDGLPIYDTRVAATAGCLVEWYRLESGKKWKSVPEDLKFPAIGRDRRIMQFNARGKDPGMIVYGQSVSGSPRWAEAKVRLGRIMKYGLCVNEELLASEGSLRSRMHALEAAFFMIGYDPKALKGNLKKKKRMW
jgi:hypothetical protein